MRTLKLTIAYDGTNYVGWQRQVNGMSVQQVVEEAFAPLAGGVAPTVAGASRTDAGVHALGQVASVNTEIDLPVTAVRRALNVRLPADIRVLAVEEAQRRGFTRGFIRSPRRTGTAWSPRRSSCRSTGSSSGTLPNRKRIAWMREAAACLVGRHDFASFQARGACVRETVRTIHRLDLREVDGEIRIECEGDGFLRHMVRTIAGTLAEVGTGLRPASAMPGILDARDRRAAGATAPACGLTLVSVSYR